VAEVLVVDANSLDETCVTAVGEGATLIRHNQPPASGGGRGGQIGAALTVARGDVVAIVHADTIVTPHALESSLAYLREHPQAIGGAVGSRFAGEGILLRLLELANDFRAMAVGISFGDQVQFFRRAPVVAENMYPAIPLMEDVELSLRLQHLGTVGFLYGDCLVSPRRWQRGAGARIWRVVALCTEYCLTRLWKTPDTAGMYKRYYCQTQV